MRTINEMQFEEICYDGMYALDYKSAMRKFYEVAVDAVPVVRCCDCKNFSKGVPVNFCTKTGCACSDDGYCSYGEKMEDVNA